MNAAWDVAGFDANSGSGGRASGLDNLHRPRSAESQLTDNDKGPECTVCKGPCKKDHG